MTVKVRTDVAESLRRGGAGSPAAKELLTTAQQLGVELKPEHPKSTDKDLARFFWLEVPDSDVEKVQDRLQHCEATEAAYLKPQDELPL
jgi:hypothetical protein